MTEALHESQLLRETAIRAALGVGDQLRTAFRAPMQRDFKRDAHDIVTVHDRAAEQSITEVLLGAGADAMIVGEEGGTRGTGRVQWHIDPIDGTSNFARGLAYWCVSIAAVVDEQVVAGVVFNPMTGDVFSADLTGARLGDAPLTSAAAAEEIDATLISSFPNPKDTWLFGRGAYEAQSRLVDSFQAVRNLGSGALNLAHVAAGWADATMGFYTNSWDIAAGGFILQQAGGRIQGLAGGEAREPFHIAPDYFAVGDDADYPTLSSVMTTWSARYDAGDPPPRPDHS
ncbi:inositol monophosphatase [Microbacterium sp. KUDC0406]|uniref:inositol monophosphatase family protein n=1 Tax=Microbacterium sp. KUDC0406 TaxID=2909588 RepID=UPI001F3BDEDD|nr:inositol monophosphatase [Microbacterium sp. KUDC0406]UJP09935.1 inositol monophosphatase [Microbacterium sp. KUDC0406]